MSHTTVSIILKFFIIKIQNALNIAKINIIIINPSPTPLKVVPPSDFFSPELIAKKAKIPITGKTTQIFLPIVCQSSGSKAKPTTPKPINIKRPYFLKKLSVLV